MTANGRLQPAGRPGRRRRSSAVVLAQLAEGVGQRGPEPAGVVRTEVRDHAGPGPTDLLEGQYDSHIAARVAVVGRHHRPTGGRSLVVIGGMVVGAVVDRA